MDPDANLKEQRELVEQLVRYDHADISDVHRLCDLVESLDGWLSRGGFLPADWSKGR